MKILVTGAAGFIGSHLSDRLLEDGHDVTGIDNFAPYYSRSTKLRNIRNAIQNGLRFHKLDLCDTALRGICHRVEVVFHCAAQPGISTTTPFLDYVQNNVIATQRLVEHFIGSDHLRLFVNIGTSSIYGANAVGPESSVPQPTSCYGVTKLAAEQLVLAAFREQHLPACSLRLFSVYGPRERPEKLIPRLVRAIATQKPFPLHEGARKHRRSFTFVSDVVDAMVSTMTRRANVTGEILNIGSPVQLTTGDVIDTVEQLMGRKAILRQTPRRQGDQLATQANIARARKILAYKPHVTPDEGLPATVSWFDPEGSETTRQPAEALVGSDGSLEY